eukprot:3168429-Pyramimonas_sp.AAC.1
MSDWMAFRSKNKDEKAPEEADRPIPGDVPGRTEPRGQRRTMSQVRRGGRQAMIQEAAIARREAQSCGRRSGWGHIGHAGFKR